MQCKSKTTSVGDGRSSNNNSDGSIVVVVVIVVAVGGSKNFLFMLTFTFFPGAKAGTIVSVVQ